MGDSPNKEVQILIPQPFMGTIIGTGGTKIKELRSVRFHCSIQRPGGVELMIQHNFYAIFQRTTAKIKIFMEPMPNSNERSIQIIGSHDQIVSCTQHFLQEISKVYLSHPAGDNLQIS